MEEEIIEVPDETYPPLKLADEEQCEQVDELYQNIQNDENISAKHKAWVDKHVAYRYLKARQFDLEQAEVMLRATLEWREDFKPDEITATDVESQIRAGHMFVEGFDKYKRPVIFLKVHTELDPHTRLEKLQFMIHCLEAATRLMDKEKGVEKMVWVCSCKGYSLKYNGDVGFTRELLSVLQNHYPERLGVLFCFDTPFIFRGMWRVVSPFIDPNTLKKVCFVGGGKDERQKTMGEYFDLDDLQENFGGNKEFEFDSDSYMEKLLQEEEKYRTIVQQKIELIEQQHQKTKEKENIELDYSEEKEQKEEQEG